jgi:hypothetical protein
MKTLIRLKSISFLTPFVLTLLMYSCTKESESVGYSTDNEYIKSISANETVVHKYLYNQTGKIAEENCLSYFKKYIYSENERLVKVESAFDRSMYSSTITERRTEFMTSQNSAVDNYSLYHYDEVGRLSKIEHYYNETGTNFDYRSMQTFEYEGINIAKVNLHEPNGQITQYHVYTYDEHGNVSNNKHYSNLFGSKDELISEIVYKYDNYKNPYQIFRMLGSPRLYANTNNIIETNTTRYDDVPGIDKQSSSKANYEYNENGYPIKEITENGEFEYNY